MGDLGFAKGEMLKCDLCMRIQHFSFVGQLYASGQADKQLAVQLCL